MENRKTVTPTQVSEITETITLESPTAQVIDFPHGDLEWLDIATRSVQAYEVLA
jgi:hypothetical protein